MNGKKSPVFDIVVGSVVEHVPLQYFQFLIVVPVAGPISGFEKTIVFIVIFFLENSKNFLIVTKSSNKFSDFLSFLGFCKIFIHFLVFS